MIFNLIILHETSVADGAFVPMSWDIIIIVYLRAITTTTNMRKNKTYYRRRFVSMMRFARFEEFFAHYT